ncbi:MAG: hypothetical protein IJN68_04625 [Clostridia bacterium]|nr:hypothetical protein [Clostridia bacterium]
MKKIISVLLAAIMLVSCFSVVSFAVTLEGNCKCDGTHNPAGLCHCCIYCPNIDPTYVTACAKASLNSDVKEVCCYECTGILGCDCGCSCCDLGDEDLSDDDNKFDDYVSEQDKQSFVDGFQAILKKVSDFFDNLFDMIFEFLGLEDVLGSEGDKLPDDLENNPYES